MYGKKDESDPDTLWVSTRSQRIDNFGLMRRLLHVISLKVYSRVNTKSAIDRLRPCCMYRAMPSPPLHSESGMSNLRAMSSCCPNQVDRDFIREIATSNRQASPGALRAEVLSPPTGERAGVHGTQRTEPAYRVQNEREGWCHRGEGRRLF